MQFALVTDDLAVSKTPPRILVASDNSDDAHQVQRLLKPEFAETRISVKAEDAVSAFDDCRPDVLVLAFDGLSRAQAYALRVYRLSSVIHELRFRTVLLCHKDEAGAAYQLCKEGTFDDYVLFWPHSHDGFRLAMSVLTAVRQINRLPHHGPSNVDLITHARQIAEVQRIVEQHVGAEGPECGDATSSVVEATAALALKQKLAPHLARMRSLRDKVRRITPVVLIVDDDAVSRELTAGVLQTKNYDVAFAPDGTSALAVLRRRRPDLILMDLVLPDTDGVALTQKLKAVPHLADIPVLMVTGDARRETLQSSMNAGAAGFIVKPFSSNSLINKVDRFLSAN